jgi:hypothetical protein
VQIFSIAGTYPAGPTGWQKNTVANVVLVECWGAGGAGGSNTTTGGSGGGGGAYVSYYLNASDITITQVQVIVGAGGTSATVAPPATNGTFAGNSQFGPYNSPGTSSIIAYGGQNSADMNGAVNSTGGGGGGMLGTAGPTGTAGPQGGGANGGGAAFIYGGGGGKDTGAPSAISVYGGGGGAGARSGGPFTGATSVFGGPGGSAGPAQAGGAGVQPGGGGGGAGFPVSTYPSGRGGDGLVRITTF